MYAITFTYDAGLVELLKLTVPTCARTWVPARRGWHVESVYAKQFADTVRGIGHTVVGLDEPRRGHGTDPTLWARLLFKRVGRSRSDQIYCALSKCLHPDVGGDTELQRKLNVAYSELPDYRKKFSMTTRTDDHSRRGMGMESLACAERTAPRCRDFFAHIIASKNDVPVNITKTAGQGP